MTHQATEGGGSLSFRKVPDHTQFEHAPTPPREPVRDTGGPNLAFEAAPRPNLAFEVGPRTQVPPAEASSDPRAILASSLTPPIEAAPKPHAFEAVPASLGIAQQRLSTPTIGQRPEAPERVGPMVPGGSGWNIRSRDAEVSGRGRAESAGDQPAWSTRAHPAAERDHSAWMVPDAPRKRRATGRMVIGIALTIILLAVLGFAGYEWAIGSHPKHTIATPATVGTLTAIHTPAAAAVSQQMQKVMMESGATTVVSGVYGAQGQAVVVVLLAQGPNIEASTKQFFSDFTSGLRTEGVTVSSSNTLNTSTGGSDFICSPATGPAPLTSLSLCAWDDGDTIGLVMNVTGQAVATTLHQAESARSAGEH
jgi:hypothetical protein